MASPNLSAELECSICLHIYTDPVTLTCGHNFCRVCIDRALDTQQGSGGYPCPICRKRSRTRPALQKNITLSNIVQNVSSAQPSPRKTPGFCTYCIHSPVLAVMSCLLCEASLCAEHLRSHNKAPEHVLYDPTTTSPESRKCSVHKKILQYYCVQDSTCICVSCSLFGDHQGHQVETLEEASEKKKRKLGDAIEKLMRNGEESDKIAQSLQEHKGKVQEKADGEAGRAATLFRELRRHLDDLEKKVQSEIARQALRVTKSCDEVTRQMRTKKEELFKKRRHMEKLCDTTDPLTVLQGPDPSGDLGDTKEGDDGDAVRCHKQLYNGGDLNHTRISRLFHTGLSDLVSGVERQKPFERRDSPPSGADADPSNPLSSLAPCTVA